MRLAPYPLRSMVGVALASESGGLLGFGFTPT